MKKNGPSALLSFRLGHCTFVIKPFFLLACGLIGLLLMPPAEDASAGFLGLRFLSSALAAFCVFLFHELGHALCLVRFGHEVLVHFQGFSGESLAKEKIPRDQEWRVLLWGPMANLIAGLLFLSIHNVLLDASSASALPAAFCLQVARLNLAFGLIGMLPVVPMDAGLALLSRLPPQHHKKLFNLGMGLMGMGALFFLVQGALLGTLLLFLIALRNHQLRNVDVERILHNIEQAEGLLGQLDTGWSALKAGELTEAERLGILTLKASKSCDISVRALDLLAWTDLARADAQSAWRRIEQGRTMSHGHARALTEALALEALGRKNEAFEKALLALEHEPSLTSARLALRLLISLEQYDEARAFIGDYPWPAQENQESLLAEVALAQGEIAQAVSLWTQAFEKTGDPQNAFDAARGHASQGNQTEALALLQRALSAGFHDLDALIEDVAFEPLRGTFQFKAIVDALQKINA